MVTSPPAVQEMQEMWAWFLGQEDLLEEGMATHYSLLTWRIPWTEETGELQSIELQRVRHDWAYRCTQPNDSCLYKRKEIWTDTQGEGKPCDDRGRLLSDASAGQGPRTAGNRQSPGRGHDGFRPRDPRGSVRLPTAPVELLASSAAQEYTPIAVRHLFYGSLLQPRKVIHTPNDFVCERTHLDFAMTILRSISMVSWEQTGQNKLNQWVS